MIHPSSWTEVLPYLLAAFAGGYLSGSIPFGLVISKMAGLGDVRTIGSGNIGATNVLRTGNKMVAAITLLADIIKGTAPVLVALIYGAETGIAAALGALIGHIFPVWLRFNGGKGVATFIGVQLGLFWQVGLIFLGVWLVVAFAFRYSSLSALVATALSPVWAALLGNWQLAQFFVLLAIIIFLTHRANIGRLLRGEETRIGAKG